MEKLIATFRVVTPMFLGGANPETCAELRVPSIKGALRFWYRALVWSKLRPDSASDDEALQKLWAEEAELFGSTDKGQSKVILTLEVDKTPPMIRPPSVYEKFVGVNDRPGARYLGYGVMEALKSSKKAAGQLTRAVLACPLEFKLCAYSKSPFHPDFINALKLFGLLGGLGSKARKGYGSLTLIDISINGVNDWECPKNGPSYITQVQIPLKPALGLEALPPFSAFSRHARVCVVLEGKDPLDLLDWYGRQMQRYRSWGYRGYVNGVPSEKRFELDRDWGKTRPRLDGFHPKRVIFGLPHNYGSKPDMQVTPVKHDRRASPLMFHIHDYGDGRFAGVATVLKAVFLPDGEEINAGGHSVKAKQEYEVLDTFLDGCGPANTKTATPYFPGAQQVFP